MPAITAHTSIPVPKVFYAFTRHGWLRCYGADRWRYNCWRMGIPQRRIEGKHPITSQVDDSRDAEHHAYRYRHHKCRRRIIIRRSGGWYLITVWAFPQRSGFHKHLRVAWSSTLTFTPRLTNSLLSMRNLTHRLFTHGDLSSLNILACGDKVVGIVDWETAG